MGYERDFDLEVFTMFFNEYEGPKLISPEEDFARHQAAFWLLELIDSGTVVDENFFNCLGWICGGMRTLAERFQTDFVVPKGRNMAHVRSSIKELGTLSYSRIEDALETIYSQYAPVRKPLLEFARTLLNERRKRKANNTGRNFSRKLADLFGLNRLELDICFFAFAINHFRPVERYFEDTMELASYPKRQLFGAIFGVTGAEVYARCAQLESMGVVEIRHGNIRLADNVETALLAENIRNAKNLFCRPVGKAELALDQFLLPPEEVEHAFKLMGRRGTAPTHLLLYGAPGGGKTSFAHALATALKVKAWAVQCGESDDTQDRRASLTACLKMASAHPGAIVIVDEAERLLDTDPADITEGTPKAWINELLERKSTRVIWITNKVHHLDQAVRRRFSYSIHFRAPAESERESMWNLATARHHAEKFLPEDKRKEFAKNYPVSFATIELALRQAKSLCWNRNFPNWIERVLKAQVTLNRNGVAPRKPTNDRAVFDPDAICINSAKESMADFLKRIGKIAAQLDKIPHPGNGSILFYGPPGTGKTALATHIADILQRKLIIRRASDLLDMFVGGTEARIAEAFEEAERVDGLLLIDEADSFLGSREGANHSWEISMTNEFLTQLQAFRGLCICTTNFYQTLDPAAPRRFFTKLEFGYAQPAHLERLYTGLLQPLVGTDIPAELLNVLKKQKNLTPGDFATCRKQFWFNDKVEHEELVKALLEEQRHKLEGATKSVGF